jgi:hypothetical protein
MPFSSPDSSDKNTPTSVLQSVATITGQRDRDLLAHSLVKTLIELIHCNRITMYRILPGEHDAEAVLVAEAYSHYAKQHGRNQVCFYEELMAAGKLSAEHYSDDMQLF